MSNRLFQTVIGQFRGTTDRVFGIIDDNGENVVCSVAEVPEGVHVPDLTGRIISGQSEKYVEDGFTYRLIGQGSAERYFVYVEGAEKEAETISGILAVAFSNLKRMYDDRNDRGALVRNIILDNILPEEIPSRARDIRMPVAEARVVFILRSEKLNPDDAQDILQNMFPDRQKDFVIPLQNRDTVLVKTLRQGTMAEDPHDLAIRISDTFSTELFIKITIGVSTVAETISDLPAAYREAAAALDVTKIFGYDKNIAEFDKLGIGRLLYNLPVPLCKKYISEVFGTEQPDILEPEMLATIQSFFDNSLNVSETSRKLFIHRNTLIYRLDKIQKTTGLDLRNFDDAITFSVALMINRYLQSRKNGGEALK